MPPPPSRLPLEKRLLAMLLLLLLLRCAAEVASAPEEEAAGCRGSRLRTLRTGGGEDSMDTRPSCMTLQESCVRGVASEECTAGAERSAASIAAKRCSARSLMTGAGVMEALALMPWKGRALGGRCCRAAAAAAAACARGEGLLPPPAAAEPELPELPAGSICCWS
jgi:hypothetical protein